MKINTAKHTHTHWDLDVCHMWSGWDIEKHPSIKMTVTMLDVKIQEHVSRKTGSDSKNRMSTEEPKCSNLHKN